MKCGRQVDKEAEYCRDCGKRERNFTQGKGIFPYDEMWKFSIEKYKYYGCREYGIFYAEAIFLFGKKDIIRWKPDRIIPVPLHRKKERKRGFNQSAYIAGHLSFLTCKFCSNGTPILKLAVHSFWFSGTRFLLKTVRFSFIIVM